jgi:Sel1 repeat/Domain of unknown function (DUF4062)
LTLLEDMRLRTPGFSFFGSRSQPALEVACEDIATSDAVLLVVGHLYGMIAPGHNRSQEEREYEEALKQGKTILVYIREEDAARVPGSVEKDPTKLPLLLDFRKRLISNHTVRFFKDIADITAQVEESLLKLFESRQMTRRPTSKPGVRTRIAASDQEKSQVPTESAVSSQPPESTTKTLPILQKALSTPFSQSAHPKGKKTMMGALAILVLPLLALGIWKWDWLQNLKVQPANSDSSFAKQALDTLVLDSTVALVEHDTLQPSHPENVTPVASEPDPLAILFEKAKTGDSTSLFRLGTMYDSGLTLPQDDSMASTHYRKAASQGMAEAQYRLALRHLDGKGTKRSKSLAIYWLQAAAQKDFPPAQAKLGQMYLAGQGVPKDQVQAMKWLLLAADKNEPNAQRALQEIKSR